MHQEPPHTRPRKKSYSGHISYIKSLLNQKHLTWVKEKKNRAVAQSSKVLISDKSKFSISFENLPSADKLHGDAGFLIQQDLAPPHSPKSINMTMLLLCSTGQPTGLTGTPQRISEDEEKQAAIKAALVVPQPDCLHASPHLFMVKELEQSFEYIS